MICIEKKVTRSSFPKHLFSLPMLQAVTGRAQCALSCSMRGKDELSYVVQNHRKKRKAYKLVQA